MSLTTRLQKLFADRAYRQLQVERFGITKHIDETHEPEAVYELGMLYERAIALHEVQESLIGCSLNEITELVKTL